MEARLETGSLWNRLIDMVKELANEARFECSAAGISIQALDSAHVAFVTLELAKDGFDVYVCHREFSRGIDLDDLSTLLRMTENDDPVTLFLDSDFLSIRVNAVNKTSEYRVKLEDIDAGSMKIPENSTSLPLAATPINSPLCVPRNVIRTTILSPSEIRSSSEDFRSGKAACILPMISLRVWRSASRTGAPGSWFM